MKYRYISIVGSERTIPACDIPDIFAGAPCGKVNTSTALKST